MKTVQVFGRTHGEKCRTSRERARLADAGESFV
ncbi:hypothetical protein DSM110093_03734 (plasmid) [Sulfitobacter sp. DSM 110093]|nr:hypothetical protein DSM110093_03734 [Sulfitobacter sp. DSM 110093]